MASVKVMACELPAQLELSLSRFSINEIREHMIEKKIVESIGTTTLWKWLHEDGSDRGRIGHGSSLGNQRSKRRRFAFSTCTSACGKEPRLETAIS